MASGGRSPHTPPLRFSHLSRPTTPFCRTAYNYAIANWLTRCRLDHDQICPCGRFRDHWHQVESQQGHSKGTQTSPTLEPPPAPRTRRTQPRMPRTSTPVPTATHNGHTRAPGGPNDISDILFGNLNGTGADSTVRARPVGGPRARRRLTFSGGPKRGASGVGSRRSRHHRRALTQNPTNEPWWSDFTDDECLGASFTSGEGEDGTTSDDPMDAGTDPDTVGEDRSEEHSKER